MGKLTLEETLKVADKLGAQLMGDNFIGFKYVRENHEFWNNLLFNLYEQGEQFGEILNETWLKSNGINYLEHDSDKWAEVQV